MPRSSRFQRDRVAKLFGNKTKLIQKPSQTEKLYMNPKLCSTPIHNKNNLKPQLFSTQEKTDLKITEQLNYQSNPRNREGHAGLFPNPSNNPIVSPSSFNQNSYPHKFRSSSYIHMLKCHRPKNNPLSRVQQIQKISFRCYEDQQIFGKQQMINFLKQNYDNDHDTPDQQVKYDVNRGVRRLQQELQRIRNMKDANQDNSRGKDGQINQVGSQRGISKSLANTPPRYVKFRHNR